MSGQTSQVINMKTWQLQHAKAHFSEMVRAAITHGPQQVTLRGEPAVVIISKHEYEKLVKPKTSFVQFMRQSPLVGIKLKIKRDTSLTREIDL